MSFIKFCAASATLIFLCSCDGNDVSLAFNTQSAPVQKYFLESSIDAMLPSDSGVTVPEAMETHLKVQATLSELVAYDNGSGRFEMKIDSVDYKSDKRTVEDYLYIEKYLLTQHFQYKMAPDGSVSEPGNARSKFRRTTRRLRSTSPSPSKRSTCTTVPRWRKSG